MPMPAARRFACLLLVLPGLAVHAAEPDKFALKDGDRVVFYGDSITDQRLYTTFVETFAVTRYPGRKMTFVHSGWGGDRVGGGGGGPIDVRLKRDVIAYHPTVVTVMLGMNDAAYRLFDTAIFQTYSEGYKRLVETLKAALPGVRLTLIRPSPFDDVTRAPNFEGGYNGVLVRFGDLVADLAKKEGADVADLNAPVVAATRRAFATDPKLAPKLNPDRVHPGPAGQLLMAAALLTAWQAPALVTSVAIDADGGQALHPENTTVEDLAGLGTMSWTQQDAALPFPIDLNDPAVALAVRSSDVVDSLDRQMLTVSGEVIRPGSKFLLKIDGEAVGTFTGEQLSGGINLAILPTPMAKQAAAVHALTLQHNNIHFLRWRQVEVPLKAHATSPNYEKALQALDALEDEVVQKQRETARPKKRKYQLIRQE
jgi:lysophospholipase L1-like esterase